MNVIFHFRFMSRYAGILRFTPGIEYLSYSSNSQSLTRWCKFTNSGNILLKILKIWNASKTWTSRLRTRPAVSFSLISVDNKVISLNQLLFAAYVEYQRLTDRGKEFADVSTCCSNTSNMCFFAAIMDTTLKWSLNTILYSSFRRFEPALHRFSLLLPVVCALQQKPRWHKPRA